MEQRFSKSLNDNFFNATVGDVRMFFAELLEYMDMTPDQLDPANFSITTDQSGVTLVVSWEV
jgi:hypothetical protein